MSFDGLMLRHVIRESQDSLIGARISKVYQLEDFTFLFTLRKHKNIQLLISASKQNTRMHISEQSFDKPYNPPMFCMFLRKHLEGARIDALSQIDNDRIVQFTLRKKDEFGDLKTLHLYYEAMGKDANLILTDESDKILDCLNHTHPFSDQRTMIPSAIYERPNDERINPFDTLNVEKIFKTHHFDNHKSLLNTFQGISPLFTKEFVHRTQDNSDQLNVFNTLLAERNFEILKHKKMVFSPFHITHVEGTTERFESASKLLDTFFGKRENHQLHQQHLKQLRSLVNKQIDKQQRKIEKLNQQLAKNEDADNYQKKGNLLLSYPHEVTLGDKMVQLYDYENETLIDIALDREKDAVENAKNYFAKFKKMKKSLPHINRQIIRAKNERTYFKTIDDQLDYAELRDLLEIRDELKEHGYLKQSKSSKKQAKKASHTTFIDPDGIKILVGKNNIQNAKITHEIAKHYHTWFHVKDSPGSHVVAQAPIDELSETTIRSAAQLAAYHSKMRYSGSVAVDYTEVKNIKKIPGHKGYFVTYKHQKTIYIDPDESFVHSLKKL